MNAVSSPDGRSEWIVRDSDKTDFPEHWPWSRHPDRIAEAVPDFVLDVAGVPVLIPLRLTEPQRGDIVPLRSCSLRLRSVLRDIVPGPAQLYEALRLRANAASASTAP